MKAFEETIIDPKYYSERKVSLDEKLPWDNINILVTKDFLKKEYDNAINEKVTSNCRQNCAGCGAAVCGTGVCFEGKGAN
jgi:hypothetical protein